MGCPRIRDSFTDRLHVANSTVTANGVTIYNATKKWCVDNTTDCGSLQFDKRRPSPLVAPNAGDYEGLAIFQDRACTKNFNLSGKALGGITGEIYAAKAKLNVQGKKVGNQVLKASFVVDKMSIGEFVATDDPDGEMDAETSGDFDVDALTGSSGRRVVLSQ